MIKKLKITFISTKKLNMTSKVQYSIDQKNEQYNIDKKRDNNLKIKM